MCLAREFSYLRFQACFFDLLRRFRLAHLRHARAFPWWFGSHDCKRLSDSLGGMFVENVHIVNEFSVSMHRKCCLTAYLATSERRKSLVLIMINITHMMFIISVQLLPADGGRLSRAQGNGLEVSSGAKGEDRFVGEGRRQER